MRTRTILAAGGLLFGSACAATAPIEARAVEVEAAQASREETAAEVIERARPAVVLVLAERPDGKIGYGAGLSEGGGLALTSLHVVDGATSIRAMLYKEGRTSYAPMDGGLNRYLFENQRDLVGATLVAGDPMTDLAILRIEADTSHLPKLAVATGAVRPGDRIFALGHPQETVWSFTEGVVGAMHLGTIQHDAAISQGSSGGPLLNARGEVVGINIAKVVSEPGGLAFARPIAMASGLLDARTAESTLDLATPERAALSCWRTQELGSRDFADCFDWASTFLVFRAVAEEVARGAANEEERARADRYLSQPDLETKWIARAREETGAMMSKPAETKRNEPFDPRRDFDDPTRLVARLRMGIRVEAAQRVAPDLTWVLLTWRNPDGSPDRFSELWAKRGDRWLQRWPPEPDNVAKLPPDWPAPLLTYEQFRAKKAEKLKKTLVDGSGDGWRSDPSDSNGGSSNRALLKAQ